MSINLNASRRELPLIPPQYCQYVGEPCDQLFDAPQNQTAFFAYSSRPVAIATTIGEAIEKLKRLHRGIDWLPWEAMDPRGQVLFCKICGSMRRSSVLIADVTTLNFNLMFEIGFAIGLGMPVILIRDTSLAAEQRLFIEVGILDTFAYVEFRNSDELVSGILANPGPSALPEVPAREYREQPIFLLKSPVPVQGSLALQSAIKKAKIRYRSFDVLETPRLSLHEARRQVAGSRGVVADLIAPSREKATAHNARSALICGMAMAEQKAVLMLQEEIDPSPQPLDYRDVVKTYQNSANVPGLTRDFLSTVVELMQQEVPIGVGVGPNPLAQIDLGDVAAENEIGGLRHYFVETGQSVQALQGHARLVIGRKGSGKTAIFYDVRDAVRRGHERLIVDMKPEGHQFLELREALLDKMGPGLQEHTMVAFWHYILLAELARFALDRDRAIARLDPLRWTRYERLLAVFGQHDPGSDLDFSQRLTVQVDRVTRRLGGLPVEEIGSRITEVIYSGDYRELNDAVQEYLRDKDAVWLLVDNLDKGWPIRGASDNDILIVRSLLEATRKIQREFSNHDLDFHCLVFLRSDIFELLRDATPDKGKDTAIQLDWEDPAVFEQMLTKRISPESDAASEFSAVWARICTPLILGQASFDYVVDRTLMRPRDVLRFVRHAMDVAMNRGHDRIAEDDLLQAEVLYSRDMLSEMTFEIADTHGELRDVLYAFEDAPAVMPMDEVNDRLTNLLDLADADARDALELLLWYGFLGVQAPDGDEASYGYQARGDLRRLTWSLRNGDAMLVVHPGFRSALRCAV